MKQKFLLLLAIVSTAIISSAFIPKNNYASHVQASKSSMGFGKFVVNYYSNGEGDQTPTFDGYVFDFYKSGDIFISTDNDYSKGTWNEFVKENVLVLDFFDHPVLSLLNDKWIVKEESESFIFLVSRSNKSELAFRRLE